MGIVQADCPACGSTVTVAPTTVTITVLPRADREGQVAFTCSGCTERVTLPVDEDLAEHLLVEGAGVTGEARARLQHPTSPRRRSVEPRPDGPPLTYDDILDFHLLLQRDDWFQDLLELTT